MMSVFSGGLGVGHEEPFVGSRFVPRQQDGPKDLQLGHEWVSWGRAKKTNGAERLPSKGGGEGGEKCKMH